MGHEARTHNLQRTGRAAHAPSRYSIPSVIRVRSTRAEPRNRVGIAMRATTSTRRLTRGRIMPAKPAGAGTATEIDLRAQIGSTPAGIGTPAEVRNEIAMDSPIGSTKAVGARASAGSTKAAEAGTPAASSTRIGIAARAGLSEPVEIVTRAGRNTPEIEIRAGRSKPAGIETRAGSRTRVEIETPAPIVPHPALNGGRRSARSLAAERRSVAIVRRIRIRRSERTSSR